jgi:hypothetical protein
MENSEDYQKNLKILVKFVNDYQVIDFKNKEVFESQREIFTNQFEVLGNEVKDAVIAGVQSHQASELDPVGCLLEDIANRSNDAALDKVIDNLTQFKSGWEGNGIEIYPSPVLKSIVGMLTAENFDD